MKPKQLLIFEKTMLLGLLCILLLQLYFMFVKYQKQFENPVAYINQNYGKDYITQYGKRYIELTKMFDHPVAMSYIGETNESFSALYFNYVLTQYYLSPNLVFKSGNTRDTVLYNLYTTIHIDNSRNYHLNNGWHVVKDFNNGLILLAK
jgi:hypothetical protein